MDGLQFTSSIVGFLAWPAAVVWLAYLLRSPLAKLVPRVRAVKYGDLHVDIGEQIEAAKEQAETESEEASAQHPEPPLSFKSLALADPRAAILSAWLPVEAELHQLATRSGLDDSRSNLFKQLEHLQRKGVLSPSLINTMLHLRQIRNTAVHVTGDSVDFTNAMEMGEMCQMVTAQLKIINESFKPLRVDKDLVEGAPER
ncbi:DUF4145 domain-containing protein [Pseudomonas sp. LP23]|uniref:DUF4145 domain-containing protein n=1 Tax=Pseudomonas sp. LP23 TaxID=3029195 RepID=UPI0030C44DB3